MESGYKGSNIRPVFLSSWSPYPNRPSIRARFLRGSRRHLRPRSRRPSAFEIAFFGFDADPPRAYKGRNVSRRTRSVSTRGVADDVLSPRPALGARVLP